MIFFDKFRNICIIHPNRFAYSETFIHNHIRHLPANMHVVYGGLMSGQMMHFSGKESDQFLVPPFFRRAETLKNIFLRLFKSAYKDETPDLKKKLSPVTTRHLSNFLLKRNIHAVLAEYGPTGVAVMDACRKADVPLIVHFHGYDAHQHDLIRTYQSLYLKMFTQAAAVIAVSRKMEKKLLQLGAPPEKIHYNVCGIDSEQFKAAHPGNNPPLFLATGRFVNKKGPHLTLLAFNKLLKKCPSARLVMVGDGPLLEPCMHLSKALNLSNSVEFAGILTHDQIALMMRKARAFVQHSVTAVSGDSEGTPVSILEACASGLPVISTRHAGIIDIIVENQTGFLVDEFDIYKMSNHMVTLAQSNELAQSVGNKARNHILKYYTMEKSINNLWKIISDQIKN